MHIMRDFDDVRVYAEYADAIGLVKDRVFMLLVLRVDDAHQNRLIGTRLLHTIATYCKHEGLRRIDVDDMSARHRQTRNIYVKCGFRYIHAAGPEMCATPRHIIECCAKRLS